MPPPLVLDANSFSASGFRHWLGSYRGVKLLPAVAYAELGVHLGRVDPDALDAGLARAGVEVEWLTADIARIAVELGLAGGEWERNARDYLIGAHAASPPRLLVTTNVKDFGFLGDRVRSPIAVMSSTPR